MPDVTHVCTCGDCEVEAFADTCKFELALRELVELKDGPRGEDYERRKPAAWEKAREVLG